MRATSLLSLLTVLLAGCATGLDQLETATPTLSSGQRDALFQNAKSPAELGLPERFSPNVAVGGVVSPNSVTAPLCAVPTHQPREAGGQFGVPVILATVNGKAGVRILLDSGSNRNLADEDKRVRFQDH